MSSAEVITAAGIQRANDIIEIANQVGLSLPVAVTLVQKESNGRNVWGSDGVSTGGAYVKGGPVTKQNYEAYRALRKAGKIGMQGVGPTQLTWWEFQDRADAQGGCWDYRTNLRVGFEILKDLQARYGTREGFRRYNGSGPAAEKYATDAMSKLSGWTAKLGARPSPAPKPAGLPELKVGSTGQVVRDLQAYLNRVFPRYSKLVVDGVFGAETDKVVREFQFRSKIKVDGVVGSVTWARLGL
jgi:hypothetical protein